MIRRATLPDVSAIHALILELARYERLESQAIVTAEQLGASLFGSSPPQAEALVVDVGPRAVSGPAEGAAPGPSIVGFALFFHNYSTFLGRRGLYLEDLFVLPDHRRRGHGRALLQELARLAVERGCGRFEWAVLTWNEPAIRFYRSLGARALEDWSIFRLSGAELLALAGDAAPPGALPSARGARGGGPPGSGRDSG